jgi:hypothetical protein
VLRKAVTTRHLRATEIRSWLRISLLIAAAISGFSPGASVARSAVPVVSASSHSRNSSTVCERSGAQARGSCVSTIH